MPLSFQPLRTAILLIGQESKKEGGKSLIKQIISCWDSSISEPPPRMLEDLQNSHVLVAQFPPPSFDCLQAVDGLRVTVIPLTFQDVHAFGGFLLYFYSPNSHEGLLLLVSLPTAAGNPLFHIIIIIFILLINFVSLKCGFLIQQKFIISQKMRVSHKYSIYFFC